MERLGTSAGNRVRDEGLPEPLAINDPNGTWGDAIEEEGQLVYSSLDSDDPDLFPRVGMTRTGEPLYDLTGWMWVPIESAEPGAPPASGSSLA